MSLPRPVALVLAGIGAALALYRFSYLPLRCNLADGRLRGATEAILNDEPMRRRIRARANLAEIERLPLYCRRGAGTQMILAANYRLLGRYGDATAAYIAALEQEKRPEIYLQLGLTQMEDRKMAEAIRNLATAVRFHAPLISDIPEALRAPVTAAVNGAS